MIQARRLSKERPSDGVITKKKPQQFSFNNNFVHFFLYNSLRLSVNIHFLLLFLQILLNACCPGWVRTDMAGQNAPKSPDEGAVTPVYLALLPPGAKEPHGKFVSDKTVQTW